MSVPRPTTCRNGSRGRRPRPPTSTSSQRCGVHRRGSRPLRSRTHRPRPSTPPRFTNAPPNCACRKSETPNGRPGTIDVSARRASESRRETDTDACAGTPLHTTCSDESDGPMRASSCDTARSRTAALPPTASASIAAPAAIPSATSAARPGAARRRTSASRTGYAALRSRVPSTRPIVEPAPASARGSRRCRRSVSYSAKAQRRAGSGERPPEGSSVN